MSAVSEEKRLRGAWAMRPCSALLILLVTGCGSGGNHAGAESASCMQRIGKETMFVGEAHCLATLPQEELSGYWVSGHEYSVFYTNKADIKDEPDRKAAWLFLSGEAEISAKNKMRAGEWQVFAIRFRGMKSTARGVYGPGPFEAGVLVSRIYEIDEISHR